MMRVPTTEHTSLPWRIHEIAPDFRIEDVWRPSDIGEGDDFERVVRTITSYDPAHSTSFAVRNLFAIRWKLGALLGLDGDDAGVGSRVPTLRDRLPADLEHAAAPAFETLPFRSLYLLDDEFAAEVANQTMHGVLHLGRVPAEDGGFRVQAAVLVKPNGLFGEAYMAFIKPFRYALVYPPMLRELGGMWRTAQSERRFSRA
jgi:hypothetical protein